MKKSLTKWLASAMLVAIAIIFISMVSGCVSFKKKQYRAELFYKTYPNELAKVCADKFPVKENFIKGQDILLHDTTVVISAVKIPCGGHDSVVCPAAKIITKYIQRIDTLVKVNTAAVDSMRFASNVTDAKISALKQQVLDTEKDRDKFKSNSITRLWLLIGLGLLITGSVAFKIYKAFSPAGVTKFL